MSDDQVVSVRLRRNTTSTPWGFRMQGGHDYGSPLYIQQVNPKSLSHRMGLRVGDRLLAIGNTQAHNMSHQQAKMEIIRAGNELDLIVQRNASAAIDQPDSRPVVQRSRSRSDEAVEESTEYRGYTNPNVQSRSFKILQESLSYSEANEEGMIAPTGSSPGEGIVRRAYSEGKRRLEELSEINPRNFTMDGESPYREENRLFKAIEKRHENVDPNLIVASAKVFDGSKPRSRQRQNVDLSQSSVLSPAAGQQQYVQQAREHYQPNEVQQKPQRAAPKQQAVTTSAQGPVVDISGSSVLSPAAGRQQYLQQAVDHYQQQPVSEPQHATVHQRAPNERPLKLVNYQFDEQYGHQKREPTNRQKAVVSPQKSTDFIPATDTVTSVAADLDLKIISPDKPPKEVIISKQAQKQEQETGKVMQAIPAQTVVMQAQPTQPAQTVVIHTAQPVIKAQTPVVKRPANTAVQQYAEGLSTTVVESAKESVKAVEATPKESRGQEATDEEQPSNFIATELQGEKRVDVKSHPEPPTPQVVSAESQQTTLETKMVKLPTPIHKQSEQAKQPAAEPNLNIVNESEQTINDQKPEVREESIPAMFEAPSDVIEESDTNQLHAEQSKEVRQQEVSVAEVSNNENQTLDTEQPQEAAITQASQVSIEETAEHENSKNEEVDRNQTTNENQQSVIAGTEDNDPVESSQSASKTNEVKPNFDETVEQTQLSDAPIETASDNNAETIPVLPEVAKNDADQKVVDTTTSVMDEILRDANLSDDSKPNVDASSTKDEKVEAKTVVESNDSIAHLEEAVKVKTAASEHGTADISAHSAESTIEEVDNTTVTVVKEASTPEVNSLDVAIATDGPTTETDTNAEAEAITIDISQNDSSDADNSASFEISADAEVSFDVSSDIIVDTDTSTDVITIANEESQAAITIEFNAENESESTDVTVSQAEDSKEENRPKLTSTKPIGQQLLEQRQTAQSSEKANKPAKVKIVDSQGGVAARLAKFKQK